MTITAAQARGARAMLDISQEDMAVLAGISRKTLTTFEAGEADVRPGTVEKVQAALEGAGAVFIDSDAGVGVMVRRAADRVA